MEGRFYDGRTSRPYTTTARIESGVLIFDADGGEHRWPVSELKVETVGDFVRLSRRRDSARLILPQDVWRSAAGRFEQRRARRRRGAEVGLVAGLTLAGLALMAFIFVGVPAASGPLARRTPPQLERQIGETYDRQLSMALRTCEGAEGQDALHAFGSRLNAAADTPFSIRVRAVEAPMANAFALPGGVILITDDLIEMIEDPNELGAVIAHEVAHVEQRHVMQGVWRALGLGLVLDALVGGGGGAGQQAVLLAGSVTDLRYSRDAEAEADARGMALLEAEGLSSEGMGPFFERLAAEEGGGSKGLVELISTHPDSARRALESRQRARPGERAFDPEAWAAIKAACADQG